MILDLRLLLITYQHRLFHVGAIFHYRSKFIHGMRYRLLEVSDLSCYPLIIPVAVVSAFFNLAGDRI